MIRTEQQWREYVDALIGDLHDYNVRYKSALELIDQYRKDSWEATDELADQMREYDALREERDELADQCSDLGARVRELEAKLEQVCKDFNERGRK